MLNITLSHSLEYHSHSLSIPPLSRTLLKSISQVLLSYQSSLKSVSQLMGWIEESCSTQLIDGDGNFNVAGVENFMKEVKLGECGLSYAVVSILGPHSSGKSTLLNHLFDTNFGEMDAFEGRFQTTKGIWIAKCAGLVPCTLVMDLGGTDGRERGEDDTAFEKQSALFALAVSDIVLVNSWGHDIGRVQAANNSLLGAVFQVMMRLFSPRKTTLMLVIRDKPRAPLEKLKSILRYDIQELWDSVPKPQAHKEATISEFFNVEVVFLSSYEDNEEQFKEQVASLRQQLFYSTAPGGLAGDRRAVVPASGFSFSSQQIWKIIKEDKYLDLPAHKVMVATVRCEEIANEKFTSFAGNEDWCQLEKAVQSGPIPGFGKKLSTLLHSFLSEYDAETVYFDEGVRSAKRKQLEAKLLQLVQLAYQSMLGHIQSGTLDKFKEAFDKALNGGKGGFSAAAHGCTQSSMTLFDDGCADAVIELANWDTSKVRDKLRRDIDAHVASVCAAKLSEIPAQYKAILNDALSRPVELLLVNSTWREIRNLLRRKTESAVSGLCGALSSFETDEQTRVKMLADLQDYARGVVEQKAREEAGRVLTHMNNRFTKLFTFDSDSVQRVWTRKENIRAILKIARSSSLKLLSVMAAIRLDDDADNIEKTLSALVESGSNTVTSTSTMSVNPLASSTWEEVPSSKTLITPVQCESLWRQFETETGYIAAQAITAQENYWETWTMSGLKMLPVLILLGFHCYHFKNRK